MSMTGYSPDEGRKPLTYLGGYPIHTPTLLVIIHVSTMIATALAQGMGQAGLIHALTFSAPAVFHNFAFWQYFTYAFVNGPSIWFAIEMLMLFQFGREVEQFMGRRSFLLLYLLLLVLTPLVLTLLGIFGWPVQSQGSSGLHFALFIAFATIYPNVAIFWTLTAKWVAAILVGIYTLQYLSSNYLPGLLTLWASAGFAHLFIRYERGQLVLPNVRLWKAKQRLRVVRDEAEPSPRSRRATPSGDANSIDPLLDKIARSGMASLTPKERAQLEEARAALLKKDRR
jgi:membrane associated rhomboid family serine protease